MPKNLERPHTTFLNSDSSAVFYRSLGGPVFYPAILPAAFLNLPAEDHTC
jgi:hypothetical protein